jgi:hypothetical protein
VIAEAQPVLDVLDVRLAYCPTSEPIGNLYAVTSKQSEATGALRTVLEGEGMTSLRQIVKKPTSEIVPLLDRMPIPPSEALLGALVLDAVADLRDVTERLERTAHDQAEATRGLEQTARDQNEAMARLDTGTDKLLKLTRWLVGLATLTLIAAIATLIASIA